MRLEILIIFSLIIFSWSVLADNYENSTVKISVDIVEPFSKIEISPSQIDLGSVTKGYATEAIKINVTNKGTLDLKIQPMLKEDANRIFENLVFSSTATCASENTCIKIGNYSFDLNRPNEIGDSTMKSFYLKLDLRDYNKEISSDLSGELSTDLVFWVMSQ